MSDFRQLSDTMMASPQISVKDIDAAVAVGVTMIINNRPDGEAADQPSGEEIEKAARAAGIAYVAIPVGQGGFSMPQVEAMHAALASAQGNVLAYCRSGTRSTFLWSLAQARSGMAPPAITAAASAAGYDISPIGPTLDMLAAQPDA